MLALPQGPSYLEDLEHGYAVFSFDLFRARSDSVLLARDKKVLSRLYPDFLGIFGSVSDVLVIAKAEGGSVKFWLGFINQELSLSLFAHSPYGGRTDLAWDTSFQLGLSSTERAWIARHILKDSIGARIELEHKLATLRSEKERARKILAQAKAARARSAQARREAKARSKAWALAVLDNLVAIETGIKNRLRIKPELEALAASWDWY